MERVTRRELMKTAAAGVGAAVLGAKARAQEATGRAARVRVAAVQMHATLGEVDANLENAEHWARLALREGAQWVVLPEFFTTAIALHPSKLVHAYRPLDGAPMQLFKKLAKEGNAYVGGSFIARSGADVFNTFVLATPSGRVFTHDKDFPTTNIESSVYAAGEDDEYLKELKRLGVTAEPAAPIPSRPDNIKDSVFPVADGVSTGVALCWEQVRYRTAKRLARRVDLILAASGWPFIVASRNVSRTNPAAASAMLDAGESVREAPRRLSRLVGAPVIHANLVGDVWNSPGSLYGDGESLLRFSGESQIIDASGKTVARRAYAEGEGLVIAEIEIGRVAPSESIPENAWWTPEAAQAQSFWATSGAAGRSVYLKTTRPQRARGTF
jgi:predicted amidohydrolase